MRSYMTNGIAVGHAEMLAGQIFRPGEMSEAAVVLEQALPGGQETGYELPCPR
jgi:hypothetical protein